MNTIFEIIELFTNDAKEFTSEETIICGLGVPLAIFALMMIAGLIETL